MIPIIYALAVFVVYALLFGFYGGVAGLFVIAFWAYVFYHLDRPKAFFRMLAYLVVGAILYGLLTSGLLVCPKEAAWSSRCRNNLKQLGLALHNYHDDNGSFPPAYVADENGKPLYSWRVLLLPQLDELQLYEEFDLSQPWDGAQNLKLLKKMPDVFACPFHTKGDEKPETTSYVAITGPDTAWPNGKPTNLNDCLDGPSNSILLIESHSKQIPWTAPVDLSNEEAVEALASTDIEAFDGHRSESLFYEYFYGRYFLLMDGSTRFAPFGANADITSELMIINDQKPDKDWDGDIPGSVAPERLRWRNVILFAAVVILTILPLPWVWWYPAGASHKASDPPDVEETVL